MGSIMPVINSAEESRAEKILRQLKDRAYPTEQITMTNMGMAEKEGSR